jgi:deazaflavin-dependent oxidoreductase (nitroreductase family)
MRFVFKIVNKLFMVPMFRLGLGPFFGNPLTGYIMVMRIIGRKTGKIRYVPVNYAIHKGSVYCLVGFGRKSPWYLNMLANPDIDLIMPGGSVAGHVEEATDDAERMLVLRQILKNGGFAGFFEGLNPFRASEDKLRARTADQPLLRIKPTGIANGASDPGGWAWLWTVAATVALIVVLVMVVH